MTKDYKLTAGPSKAALLLGLSEKKALTFRAVDDAGNVCLFEIVVRRLELLATDKIPMKWILDGIIVSKNRVDPEGKRDLCHARFDSHTRQGKFREMDSGPSQYSYEYFDGLSDVEILQEIATSKRILPDRIRELKEYAATLSPHHKLVLEALHIWGLYGACVDPRLEHQMSEIMKANRH